MENTRNESITDQAATLIQIGKVNGEPSRDTAGKVLDLVRDFLGLQHWERK